ncbi:MAG: NHL repeat-containing protein [Candidatus Cybelea sp.]
MRLSFMKYAITNSIAILLLTSCAGGSPILTMQQVQSRMVRQTSSCPCLYATDGGSVTVYPERARGDATPIQDISGGSTGLGYPVDIAVDGSRNMYVLNSVSGGASVEVFAAGATGDVAPVATIAGSYTDLVDPTAIALDPVNGDIYVTNKGNNSVTIYAPSSNGNVAPLGVIKGSHTVLDFPFGLAIDRRGRVYISNYSGTSITVYAAGSTGNVAPIRTISGFYTELTLPYALALDSSANIYVLDDVGNRRDNYLTVYPAGANGNVAPIQNFSTEALYDPEGIAVDRHKNMYVSSLIESRVVVYAAGSTGDVNPIRTIKGSNTGLYETQGIAIR